MWIDSTVSILQTLNFFLHQWTPWNFEYVFFIDALLRRLIFDISFMEKRYEKERERERIRMDNFLRRIASHEDVTSPWKRRNARSSIKSARRFLALAMWTSRKLIKSRPLSGGRAPFRDVTVDMTYRHAANSLITHDQISRWQDVAGWWKADKLDEQAEKKGFYVGSILGDRYACSMDQFFRAWFISFFFQNNV